MAGLSCQDCQRRKRCDTDLVLLKITFKECTTRPVRPNEAKPIDEFYHVINSFLNGIGGSVMIHADQDVNIDDLDKKVDYKLLALIPDNALYQEVYERYLLDAKHVLYRVLPRVGSRPYSVFNFNTRFSLSVGTVEPTYGQMNDFVDHITGFRLKEDRDFSVNRRRPDKLIGGQQVMVTRTLCHVGHGPSNNENNSRSASLIPLSENMCTQAKAYFITDPNVKIEEYCWNHSKPYISAFTKIPGGGSVYIGIQELAGKLKAQGVYLTDANKTEIKTFFGNKIDEGLMWIGLHEHQQVVEIDFLDVFNTNGQRVPNTFVVEVQIKQYYGLCFQKPSGPDLYTTSMTNGNVNTGTVIPVEAWLRQFNSHSDLLIQPGTDQT